LLNVSSAKGEALDLVEVKTDVPAQVVSVRAVVEVIVGCCRKPIPSNLSFALYFLLPITQSHQFIDLGYDTTLFGNWRKGEQRDDASGLRHLALFLVQAKASSVGWI
jgi:hypothetical protein